MTLLPHHTNAQWPFQVQSNVMCHLVPILVDVWLCSAYIPINLPRQKFFVHLVWSGFIALIWPHKDKIIIIAVTWAMKYSLQAQLWNYHYYMLLMWAIQHKTIHGKYSIELELPIPLMYNYLIINTASIETWTISKLLWKNLQPPQLGCWQDI